MNNYSSSSSCILTDISHKSCSDITDLIINKTSINSYIDINNCELLKKSNNQKYIFIIPIFGENELIEPYFQKIIKILKLSCLLNSDLLFLLIGDVHASDDQEFLDMPIIKQLKFILRHTYSPSIYPVKLSHQRLLFDNLHIHEIQNFIIRPQLPYLRILNELKRKIGKGVHWNDALYSLNFTVSESGLSSLKNKTMMSPILNKASNLPVNELNLERSSIEDINELKPFFNSEITKLNISSNQLSALKGISVVLPKLNWLSVAANHLSDINFNDLPSNIKVFLAHKNNIASYELDVKNLEQLERISLYRNNIYYFDSLFQLPNLKKINIGANPVSSLPASINISSQLRSLGIARTNITFIPEWILESKYIEEVDISYIEHNIKKSHINHLKGKGVNLIFSPFINTTIK